MRKVGGFISYAKLPKDFSRRKRMAELFAQPESPIEWFHLLHTNGVLLRLRRIAENRPQRGDWLYITDLELSMLSKETIEREERFCHQDKIRISRNLLAVSGVALKPKDIPVGLAELKLAQLKIIRYLRKGS